MLHKGMTGRNEDNGPATTKQDKTLADYLERKYFDPIKEEPKMTFEDWYSQSGWAVRHEDMLSLDDADSVRYCMQVAWVAAQKNK